MKKLIQVQEVEGQGLEALLGKTVLLFCVNYIYTGVLIGVNEHDIILDKAGIVYETGAFTDKKLKDCQFLPSSEWRIRTSAIESYGVYGE
jgi:ferredoxin-fold anticodon binding domain-containing protein